jgi:hypothetical protein
MPEELEHALIAGTVAAIVSGAPSTAHALLTGADPMEASYAAGSMVLGGERRHGRLFLAAVPVHGTLSLGWAVVLAKVLPRRHTALAGALAGVAIGALDMGVIARLFPRVHALPLAPQIADHIAYGATVGAVLARLRRR